MKEREKRKERKKTQRVAMLGDGAQLSVPNECLPNHVEQYK